MLGKPMRRGWHSHPSLTSLLYHSQEVPTLHLRPPERTGCQNPDGQAVLALWRLGGILDSVVGRTHRVVMLVA
ncbi:hypothetical protein IG631_01877 [Alternaria alternata]|nr:hypothetical protein IG631_01877 [Alternaria alternata]